MLLIIGVFQMLAMIPGTSRSGATIVGALLLGVSRAVATEFTFFLAIPAMFGASAVKLIHFGLSFTAMQLVLLILGMVVSFAVSIVAIKFLMRYIKSMISRCSATTGSFSESSCSSISGSRRFWHKNAYLLNIGACNLRETC